MERGPFPEIELKSVDSDGESFIDDKTTRVNSKY